jgi:hypothetical protein
MGFGAGHWAEGHVEKNAIFKTNKVTLQFEMA